MTVLDCQESPDPSQNIEQARGDTTTRTLTAVSRPVAAKTVECRKDYKSVFGDVPDLVRASRFEIQTALLTGAAALILTAYVVVMILTGRTTTIEAIERESRATEARGEGTPRAPHFFPGTRR